MIGGLCTRPEYDFIFSPAYVLNSLTSKFLWGRPKCGLLSMKSLFDDFSHGAFRRPCLCHQYGEGETTSGVALVSSHFENIIWCARRAQAVKGTVPTVPLSTRLGLVISAHDAADVEDRSEALRNDIVTSSVARLLGARAAHSNSGLAA